MIKLRASTKQMVKEEKEKLKLDRSASNAQATNQRQTRKFNFTKRKQNSWRKSSKSRWQKPLLKKAAEKSTNSWQNEQKKNNIYIYKMRSKQSKKSRIVPQVMDGGGVQVGPPEMPGIHQPSTFSRNIKVKGR